MLFFFCKQKTAYEMRISDWSSDVCSSDLGIQARHSEDSASPGGSTRLLLLAEEEPHPARHLLRRSRATHLGRPPADERAGAPEYRARHRPHPVDGEIGRASCRERVCQTV